MKVYKLRTPLILWDVKLLDALGSDVVNPKSKSTGQTHLVLDIGFGTLFVTFERREFWKHKISVSNIGDSYTAILDFLDNSYFLKIISSKTGENILIPVQKLVCDVCDTDAYSEHIQEGTHRYNTKNRKVLGDLL